MLIFISPGVDYRGSIFYICQLLDCLSLLFVTRGKYINIEGSQLVGKFGTGYAFNKNNYEQLRIPQSPLNQSS